MTSIIAIVGKNKKGEGEIYTGQSDAPENVDFRKLCAVLGLDPETARLRVFQGAAK